MTNDDYIGMQAQLEALARLTVDLPFAEFLATIGRTHAIAPIFDPTLYRKGASALTAIEQLARAAQHFARVAREALATIDAERASIRRPPPPASPTLRDLLASANVPSGEPEDGKQ